MSIIAITGGIGSGKSAVSRMLSVMGMLVYDCDSRAKSLMDRSDNIKRRIATEISPDCISSDNTIDRGLLSRYVFNDAGALDRLNKIVHGAVREDFNRWCVRHKDNPMLFVETAILYQSGMDSMVDGVWEVVASEDTRVARVMARNHCPASEVKARISSQNSFIPRYKHPRTIYIDNDGSKALLQQVLSALADSR